jgi:hypothetical protein
VILAVLKETEPAILEARFTVKEGDGSWVKRTVNVVVAPSDTWFVPAVSSIFIVSSSTVDIFVLAAAIKGVPDVAERVTVSLIIFASCTPLIGID